MPDGSVNRDYSVPQLSDSEALDLIGVPFGVSRIEKRFHGERDLNLLCFDGARQILVKIANSGEGAEALEFQHALLGQLHEKAPGVGIPKTITVVGGHSFAALRASNGTAYLARALTFLEGIPLAEARPAEPKEVDRQGPRLWRAIGRRLGEISKALEGWDHPGAHQPSFLWNLDNVEQSLAWRSEIGQPEIAELVEQVVADRLPSVVRFRETARKGVIYGDANDHNILVASDDPHRLVGFIDFGDACFGCSINELAICLAYVAMHAIDPVPVFERVAAGFASKMPITESEIEVLPALVMLRLSQSLCISSHNAGLFPGNADYLRISQQPATDLLRKLAAVPAASILNRLRIACGFGAVECDPSLSQTQSLLDRRRSRIAPSLSVAYREPATIVRGEGCYLYDDTGRAYLDLVNNVAHVGHAHPHVVRALSRQAGLLNTNARYLHPLLLDYADRITATMPPQLSVCIFVCTGSEANELALRMARTVTSRRDAVVLDMAYHGHSDALIDISAYKFARKGGAGRKSTTHVAAMPDPYRGAHRGFTEETGIAYGAEVAAAVHRSIQQGGPALFIAESFLGVGGQVILPPRFLETAYAAVRQAGGLCIADEVQVGFGRPGHTMWAFEQQGVIPDIVTLGKPIGAGHPMAAVVTTPEIANQFANGMEYFNTYGGNAVSCAVGMAVLDVIEDEDLMGNAVRVGGYIQDRLSDLAAEYDFIGDVRGQGLFIGAEIVKDRISKEPDTERARGIAQQLRHLGVFLSTDGPDDNVLKIKPPMVIGIADVDFFIDRLSQVLTRR